MKAGQRTGQRRKKDLVSTTSAEGAYKVNMTVASDGQDLDGQNPFPTVHVPISL